MADHAWNATRSIAAYAPTTTRAPAVKQVSYINREMSRFHSACADRTSREANKLRFQVDVQTTLARAETIRSALTFPTTVIVTVELNTLETGVKLVSIELLMMILSSTDAPQF